MKALSKAASRSEAMKASWARRRAAEFETVVDPRTARGLKQFVEVNEHLAAEPNGPATIGAPAAGELPGKGELIGGNLAQRVEHIAELLAEKGGKDAVQTLLESMLITAKNEGMVERDATTTERINAVHQDAGERAVCGWISEVDTAMTLHGGLPQRLVWNMNSYLVCRIVDALNRAGYTPNGRVKQ